jgi:Putative adipose-regulatory protein (Seipin)
MPPWGYVDLEGTNLLSGQPYATFVELELPRTRNNLEIGFPQNCALSLFTGNFMVSLTFLTSFNQTIATSSRPAILTYMSPIISTSLTFLNSPLIISGFKKESETLLILVMERFEFASPRGSRPSWAYMEITAQGNRIQVYSTKLMFVAQLEGVR